MAKKKLEPPKTEIQNKESGNANPQSVTPGNNADTPEIVLKSEVETSEIDNGTNQATEQPTPPPADEAVNTYRIYDQSINRIQYYLNKAALLNSPRTRNHPPYKQLSALRTKYKNTLPLLQMLYTNLWTDELKTIQKVFHSYIKNPAITPKERDQVINAEEKIMELIQKSLVARPVIGYLIVKYRAHQKTLGKMLRLNEIESDPEIDNPEEPEE